MENTLADFAKDMGERGHVRTITELSAIEDEDEDEGGSCPNPGNRDK